MAQKSNHTQFGRKIGLLLLSLFFPFTSPLFAAQFKGASDIWSPFFMEKDGKHLGIGVDILQEVMKRSGHEAQTRTMPTNRARIKFSQKQIDMMVVDSPMWNEKKDLDNMVFSKSYLDLSEYIWFKKEKFIDVKSPKDLKGKRVFFMAGYIFPAFEEALKSGLVLKGEATTEPNLIKMLVSERADAIFMDEVAFQFNIVQQGLNPDDFKNSYRLSHTGLSINLRKEHAHYLPSINKAIEDMQRDGTIKRIVSKYTSK